MIDVPSFSGTRSYWCPNAREIDRAGAFTSNLAPERTLGHDVERGLLAERRATTCWSGIVREPMWDGVAASSKCRSRAGLEGTLRSGRQDTVTDSYRVTTNLQQISNAFVISSAAYGPAAVDERHVGRPWDVSLSSQLVPAGHACRPLVEPDTRVSRILQ